VRLAAIAAAGVALRTLYLFTVARHVTGIGDWHFYHWQANLIADGHGFTEPYKLLFDHHVSPSAGHPPLYPLALSAVSLLGGTGELAHRLPGLGFGAITIVLVGLLGRRVGGERVGLVAAGLCAVYPIMIAVDGALMSETLYGPLVAASLLAAYGLLDHPSRGRAALLGTLLGLAALVRSEALLFVPLLAWPVAWRGGGGGGWPLTWRGVRRWPMAWRGGGARRAAWRGGRGWAALALVAALACAAVVTPWTIRNAVRFHALVPISTNDSTVLAGANCPLTYHGIDTGGWNLACISPRREDNEARQADIWRREGLGYARDHAGRLPAVAGVRLLRMWDLWQPRRQVMFAEGRQRRVEQAGIAVYYALMVLGAVGVAALRRRRETLLVLLAPAVVVCLTAITGYGVSRLRHSFEIPLLVLAATGLLALWPHVRERGAARNDRRDLAGAKPPGGA
jgi:hypothetical protein